MNDNKEELMKMMRPIEKQGSRENIKQVVRMTEELNRAWESPIHLRSVGSAPMCASAGGHVRTFNSRGDGSFVEKAYRGDELLRVLAFRGQALLTVFIKGRGLSLLKYRKYCKNIVQYIQYSSSASTVH